MLPYEYVRSKKVNREQTDSCQREGGWELGEKGEGIKQRKKPPGHRQQYVGYQRKRVLGVVKAVKYIVME